MEPKDCRLPSHYSAPRCANHTTFQQREKEHILRDITSDKRELAQTVQELKSQGRSVQSDLQRISQSIEQLDSQQGQNISFLKKISPEAHRGWEWLQENLGRFEKEVFGPPMLTCSLRDERYSDLVQSMLMPSDFLCFTCQTRNDHKILSDEFYKKMGLSVTIRTCGTDFRSFRSPASADEIRQLGLDGFAIDYLEGPEPVLAMLCSERYLHTSGVALKELSPQQFDALQKGQRINTWATGKTYFRVIRRREYGPDATTTSTRKVNKGRFWTDQPVDAAEKAEFQKQLKEKLGDKEELVGQLHETKARIEARTSEEDKINEDLVSRPTPLHLVRPLIDYRKISNRRRMNCRLPTRNGALCQTRLVGFSFSHRCIHTSRD
jgi:structural maintenance of chromosomes protein 5